MTAPSSARGVVIVRRALEDAARRHAIHPNRLVAEQRHAHLVRAQAEIIWHARSRGVAWRDIGDVLGLSTYHAAGIARAHPMPFIDTPSTTVVEAKPPRKLTADEQLADASRAAMEGDT